MSRFAKGYAFEREVANSLKNVGLWNYKFVDTHAYEFLSKNRHVLLPKVPADFLCVVHGQAVFLECKSSSRQYSFNTEFIAEHQWAAAKAVTDSGGEYYFVLGNRFKRRHYYLLILTYQTMHKLKRAKPDKKHYSWKFLRDYAVRFEKVDKCYPGLGEFILRPSEFI